MKKNQLFKTIILILIITSSIALACETKEECKEEFENNPTSETFNQLKEATAKDLEKISNPTIDNFNNLKNEVEKIDYLRTADFSEKDKAIAEEYFSNQEGINVAPELFQKFATSQGVSIKIYGFVGKFDKNGLLNANDASINIYEFKDKYNFEIDENGNLELTPKNNNNNIKYKIKGDITLSSSGNLNLESGEINGQEITGGKNLHLENGKINGKVKSIAGIEFETETDIILDKNKLTLLNAKIKSIKDGESIYVKGSATISKEVKLNGRLIVDKEFTLNGYKIEAGKEVFLGKKEGENYIDFENHKLIGSGGNFSISFQPLEKKIGKKIDLKKSKNGKYYYINDWDDNEVKKLQQALIQLGYLDEKNKENKDNIDGDYGPITKAAVEKFQKDYGLIADGKFGKNTLAAINQKMTITPKEGSFELDEETFAIEFKGNAELILGENKYEIKEGEISKKAGSKKFPFEIEIKNSKKEVIAGPEKITTDKKTYLDPNTGELDINNPEYLKGIKENAIIKAKLPAEHLDLIIKASLDLGVDPAIALALLTVENSKADPNAVSSNKDSSDIGLFQINSKTINQNDYNKIKKLNPEIQFPDQIDIRDPRTNAYYGILRLKSNFEAGKKELESYSSISNSKEMLSTMYASYNGGSTALEKSNDCEGNIPKFQCEWDNKENTIPNTGYAITRAAAEKFVKNYKSIKGNTNPPIIIST